jgi:hypothetical protein
LSKFGETQVSTHVFEVPLDLSISNGMHLHTASGSQREPISRTNVQHISSLVDKYCHSGFKVWAYRLD